jgi:hypothetical protein
MWGSKKIPGFEGGVERRLYMNKIFVGQPESTWMRIFPVKNSDAAPADVAYGLVIYEDLTDGTFSPVTTIDATLNDKRLAVVVDENVTAPANGEIKCNLAIAGELDKDQLVVDGVLWADLSDVDKVVLEAAMKRWGFGLALVMQV